MADREEQYVLRVQDKAVAARIRKQLNLEHSQAKLDVRFDGRFHRDQLWGTSWDCCWSRNMQHHTILQVPTVMVGLGNSALVRRSSQSCCSTYLVWLRATKHMMTVIL